MDYFFGCQKSTFNLENNKCICQGNFFGLQRNWIYLLQNCFSSYVYVKDIYKTLNGIGKIQFVSELTILLNLQISKFHGSLHKEKNKVIKA